MNGLTDNKDGQWMIKIAHLEWWTKTRNVNNGLMAHPHQPPPPWIFSFLLLWPWKLGQSHQNLISSLLCPNYRSWKFTKNPTNGSQDIVQTRKCEANTNTDANANEIIIIIIILGFLINVQVQGQHPHRRATFQIAGLLHPWQISHQISRCVYHEGR